MQNDMKSESNSSTTSTETVYSKINNENVNYGNSDTSSTTLFGNKVDDVSKKVNDLKEQVNNYASEFKNQSNRNIEIIGLFSSILAILIIDVNIIKSASNFLSGILMIIGLTSCMSIFAILIHSLFNEKPRIHIYKYLNYSIYVLIVLVIIGIIAQFFDLDIQKDNYENNNKKIALYLTI